MCMIIFYKYLYSCLSLLGEALNISLRRLLLIALLLFSSLVNADHYPDRGEILLGMSTALSGPAAELGKNMLLGINARLALANENGGVHGRPLRLLAWDDGYEPDRTAPNMRKLIEDKNVLAVIGNVGTPTAISAIPIANESKTLFFAPFTGAGVLRKTPPDRYVINYRASYAEETSAMVDALMKYGGLKPEEVAFFTQRDGYGDAGYVGGISALLQNGLRSEAAITHSRYERNTIAVENALADILLADPEPKAVIMVGAYAPCARFIQLARNAGIMALFINTSFVGSEPLARALGENIEGVVVTQVVPHPSDKSVPIVREYLESLNRYSKGSAPSFGSLEGYISAKILIRALRIIEGPPTREKVIDALEAFGEFEVGTGHTLYFDKKNHQASHAVWPTILRKGQFVSFNWAEIAGFYKGE